MKSAVIFKNHSAFFLGLRHLKVSAASHAAKP